MKDLGEPKNFLGMTIERNRKERSILIHQASYAENVIERYLKKECAQKDTPMVTRQVKNKNKRLKENAENSTKDEEFEKHPYREAIGSLMYLANATRPDIAYAVNFLARMQVNPTEDD